MAEKLRIQVTDLIIHVYIWHTDNLYVKYEIPRETAVIVMDIIGKNRTMGPELIWPRMLDVLSGLLQKKPVFKRHH